MLEIFENNKELGIIIMAMLPVIELRGAIPMGIALGFSPFKSLLLSLIGNIAVIPIVLYILLPLMDLVENTKIFKSTIGWLKDRSLRKTKDKIKKYSLVGLYFFVALPLPSTGVWTGALAASLLNLDYRKSFISMSLGVVSSGLIVVLLSKNLLN